MKIFKSLSTFLPAFLAVGALWEIKASCQEISSPESDTQEAVTESVLRPEHVPFPLPELPPSPNSPFALSSSAKELDKKRTIPTESNLPDESEPTMDTEGAEQSGLSREAIEFLMKALHDERTAMRNLANQITTLKAEITNIRQAIDTAAKKEAEEIPRNAVTLSLEFPSERQNIPPTETQPETGSLASVAPSVDSPQTSEKQISMQPIKPIPIFYAHDNVRAALANAEENLVQNQHINLAMTRADNQNKEGTTAAETPLDIEKAQEDIDRLSAQIKYLEIDASQQKAQAKRAAKRESLI